MIQYSLLVTIIKQGYRSVPRTGYLVFRFQSRGINLTCDASYDQYPAIHAPSSTQKAHHLCQSRGKNVSAGECIER